MRKYFITGLMVLLPAVVTITLVSFFANLLTKPFVGLIQQFLASGLLSGLDEQSLAFLNLISRVIALVFIIGAIFFIGLLAHVYILGFLGRLGELIIDNIPIVNKIYHATRDVVKTIFESSQKEQRFSKVVMVPYPYEETRSLGLVPSEYLPEGTDKEREGMIPVFVPGSPNPTMGFMMMYRREDVEFLTISVEDALHMIISLGVVWNEEGNNAQQ